MAKFSIRKWAKVCVALGGVAFSATAAQAGDPCACAPVVDCCTPSDCCDGSVASELCRLTEDCCGDSCCGDGCDGCGDEGCSILGGLFGRFSCGDDSCDSCDIIDDCCADACDGCGDDNGIDIGGWLQAGYHNRNNGLFNSHPDRFNVHQAWLYAEKVADGSDGIGFGGRVDFMYGVDAADTQAFGNNPGNFDFANGWDHGQYGFAMPQLYAEVAYGDLSVIVGHFYTLLGYEVVTAPDNFFYSHAYTMYNSEAFTHTGALATYTASDNLTLYAGWTLGWDTGFDQRFGGSSFLGGYSVGLGDNASFTHIITAGDFGNIGDGFSQSLVLDVALTDDLNYVVQSDILRTNGMNSTNTDTIGLNQYLLYTVNDKLAVGGRAEWWKTNGTSIYAMTAGLNIRPMDNVVIRPEIRFDWEPAGTNTVVAADAEGKGQFGVDVILTF